MSRYPNYITSTFQNVNSVTGNCSMIALSRLSATYTPQDKVKKHNQAVIDQYCSSLTKSKQARITLFPEKTASLNTMRLQAHIIPGMSTGLAIPVEWGFATLLDEIVNTRNPTILFCSDVENGGTDGHRGDYRTGNFADWCLSEGIARGDKAISKKVRSSTTYEVYAWNLVFNPEEARRLISRQTAEFNEFLKNISKSNNLDAVIAAAKQAFANQKKVLNEAWEQWNPDPIQQNNIVEETTPATGPSLEGPYIREQLTALFPPTTPNRRNPAHRARPVAPSNRPLRTNTDQVEAQADDIDPWQAPNTGAQHR